MQNPSVALTLTTMKNCYQNQERNSQNREVLHRNIVQGFKEALQNPRTNSTYYEVFLLENAWSIKATEVEQQELTQIFKQLPQDFVEKYEKFSYAMYNYNWHEYRGHATTSEGRIKAIKIFSILFFVSIVVGVLAVALGLGIYCAIPFMIAPGVGVHLLISIFSHEYINNAFPYLNKLSCDQRRDIYNLNRISF